MPPRDWRLRIVDILSAIAAIQEYTQGMDCATFAADRKTVDAVLRNVAVIGEAASRVSDQIVDANPEVPWRDMRDMRNILVHEYFGVSIEILWDTVQSNLPPLVAPLRLILENAQK
jgi:uncharacterized protein with HEPN domain